jgi:3'-phosphoadenosine 5'-phosphosulfate (PAPS) 3'-phosphatase
MILITKSVPVVESLQVGLLLSTCIEACERGCVAIRSVHNSRVVGKGTGNIDTLGAELKDMNDPRSVLTKADKDAQIAIVGSLRLTWGTIDSDSNSKCPFEIIGEEDNDETMEGDILNYLRDPSQKPLCKDLLEYDIGETPELDPSEVTIFVDPLDGTREFVEGRLSNCQVLVGIAIGGEAIAGVIGIPFPSDDTAADDDLSTITEPTIIYGLADVGTGVRGSTLTRGPFPLDRHIDGVKYPRPHHATGDTKVSVMEACRKAAIRKHGGSTVIYGGAGNKILAAALGEVSSTFQHKVGGAWDLCAPQAILNAMGGKMTDIFGEEIAIYRKDAPSRCSERGYIATPPGSPAFFHEGLAAAFNSLPEIQQYKKDIEN